MKKIFKHLTTKRLRESLVATAERMPLSVLFVVLGFGIVVTEVAIGDTLSDAIQNLLGKSMVTLTVMCILSVALYLFSESVHVSKLHRWRNQLVTLVFGLLFYLSFEENLFSNFYSESFVHIAMTIVGVLAAVFIAPFVSQLVTKEGRHELSQRAFYIFAYDTMLTLAMAAIVGMVTMLLGFLAWWALDTLFGLPSSFNDVYGYWAAFTHTLLAPLFVLANLSSTNIDIKRAIETDKFFGFLTKYIGLPAITFYFVILYAYTVKVLINFSDWPHGEVAWMVIGFSFFGYVVYVASYIFEDGFRPATTFRKLFPYMVLPQVVMLFYAIGLRIAQYDVTINRYLVVAFGAWLLLLSLHFIMSKRKYLGSIPLAMILFIIITSLGPWSVYSYPEARQLTNLVENLREAGLLAQDGSITPLESVKDITAELSGEIYSTIEYMCNNHGCDALESVLSNELALVYAKDIERFEKDKVESIKRLNEQTANNEDVQEPVYHTMSSWSIINDLSEHLNVERYDGWSRDSEGVQQYITFTAEGRNHEVTVVTGYDYHVQLNSGRPFIMREQRFKENGTKYIPQYEASLDVQQGELRVRKAGEVLEVFDVSLELARIVAGENTELVMLLQGNQVAVKVVLYDITLQNPKWTESVESVDERGIHIKFYNKASAYGYVLIKE